LLALFALLHPGDHIVASNKLYGGTITQFGSTFKKFGWKCTFVDADDINAVKAALSEHNNVKALWVESLANPGGVISDLDKLSAAAHDVGVPFLVDNTMATPFLCKPIEYGADIVVHSTTKFLAGHGQAMGGSVLL
jgi:O-acetylhomoserine (thiol)-lyase